MIEQQPAPAVSVTETSLAQQFMAFDDSTWGIRLSLSRNLWAGWKDARREGITQHVFLTRIIGEIQRKGGKNRSVNGLYHYLYAGCADDAGFSFLDLEAGQLIGKTLDRLGHSPEVVQSHLDAGNLAEVVAKSRAPTTTLRMTTESKGTLDATMERTRALVETTGMSDAEIRSLPLRALDPEQTSPHFADFVVLAANGEIDLNDYRIEKITPGQTHKTAGHPISLVQWGKLNAPCIVCHRPPTESGFPHHAHHVQAGAHDPRPNDDTTEVLWAWACPSCHVAQPGRTQTTAHKSEYALHFDGVKLEAYLRYFARCVRLYQQAIGART